MFIIVNVLPTLLLLMTTILPSDLEATLIFEREDGLYPYEECKFSASGHVGCMYGLVGTPKECEDRFKESWKNAIGSFFDPVPEYPNADCRDFARAASVMKLVKLCLDEGLGEDQCEIFIANFVEEASPGPFCFKDTQECPQPQPPVARDPKLYCQFPPCPNDIACTLDAKQCDDGSFVSRDPMNDCKFQKCPPNACIVEATTYVSCDYTGGKKCKKTFKKIWKKLEDPCNGTTDASNIVKLVKVCDSTSILTEESCQTLTTLFLELTESKPTLCAQDIQTCSGGATVGRDPNNNCEFPPCSEVKCCDPTKEFGQFGNLFCFEGHRCCPSTGEWTCSIGDGKTFPCDGESTMGPFGSKCCCDPNTEPGKDGSSIPYVCCPTNGEWALDSGDGTFLCDGKVFTVGPFGSACA